MHRLRETGHTITYDWTQQVEEVGPSHENEKAQDPEFLHECAVADVQGVRDCDWFVAIGNKDACGTLIELGIAVGLKKPIYILDIAEFRYSIFWRLPQVFTVHDEDVLVSAFSSNVATQVNFA